MFKYIVSVSELNTKSAGLMAASTAVSRKKFLHTY